LKINKSEKFKPFGEIAHRKKVKPHFSFKPQGETPHKKKLCKGYQGYLRVTYEKHKIGNLYKPPPHRKNNTKKHKGYQGYLLFLSLKRKNNKENIYILINRIIKSNL